MPTFTPVANPSGMPSAPQYTTELNVTFATPADDYVAGGYLMGLANRVGAGRTIRAVHIESETAATGAWDARLWQYNRTTDRLMAFDMAGAEIAGATDVSAARVRMHVESS